MPRTSYIRLSRTSYLRLSRTSYIKMSRTSYIRMSSKFSSPFIEFYLPEKVFAI